MAQGIGGLAENLTANRGTALAFPYALPLRSPMRTLLTFLLLCICGTAFAEFQPLDEIRSAAITAVTHGAPDAAGATTQVTLDANLQMPKCGSPLQAQSGQSGVSEVTCIGPTAWKLYVPVRVAHSQSVVVLTRPIGAGQPITAEAIVSENRNAAAIVGAAIYDPAQAIGRVAVRTLVAGSPLLDSDLVSPRAVHRGEAVMLVVRGLGVDVRAPGKAMNDAGLNERINVENVGSHRVVQGIVRAGGEVEIAQ